MGSWTALTLVSDCHAEGSVSILRGGGRLAFSFRPMSPSCGWDPYALRSPNRFRISFVVISPLALYKA
jgi:hypothetical protein